LGPEHTEDEFEEMEGEDFEDDEEIEKEYVSQFENDPSKLNARPLDKLAKLREEVSTIGDSEDPMSVLN